MSKKHGKTGTGGKILCICVLGCLLISGLVAIGFMLFTESFKFDNSSTVKHNEYNGENFKFEENEGARLRATYLGRTLYGGGQACRSDFKVEIVKNGVVSEIDDYECAQLEEEYRLVEGDNVFEFRYGKARVSTAVYALSVDGLAIAPTYITHPVDIAASEDKVNRINDGTLSYAEAFSEAAFTGDSQIKALSSYEILGTDRIVAEVGMSYDYMEQHIDEIINKAAGKKYLVTHYGINTISSNAEYNARQIEQYKKLLNKIQDTLPDIQIVVTCVFPVADSIKWSQERFGAIDEFNFMLCKMSMEIGADFISDTRYMNENPSVFGTDGLHLTKNFYTDYWLKNLIMTAGI